MTMTRAEGRHGVGNGNAVVTLVLAIMARRQQHSRKMRTGNGIADQQATSLHEHEHVGECRDGKTCRQCREGKDVWTMKTGDGHGVANGHDRGHVDIVVDRTC